MNGPGCVSLCHEPFVTWIERDAPLQAPRAYPRPLEPRRPQSFASFEQIPNLSVLAHPASNRVNDRPHGCFGDRPSRSTRWSWRPRLDRCGRSEGGTSAKRMVPERLGDVRIADPGRLVAEHVLALLAEATMCRRPRSSTSRHAQVLFRAALFLVEGRSERVISRIARATRARERRDGGGSADLGERSSYGRQSLDYISIFERGLEPAVRSEL